MNTIQNLRQLSCNIISEGPNDKKLLERSLKSFDKSIEWVRKIMAEVKKDSVQEVCKFGLDNFYFRVIEQRDQETISTADYIPRKPLTDGYTPALPIVFYIENTCVIGNPEKFESVNAIFFRNADGQERNAGLGEFIGLRDPKDFTPLFAAINLLHETRHALDSRNSPNYGSWDYEKRELVPTKIETSIIHHYGGRNIIRVAKKHRIKIEKISGVSLDECPIEIIDDYMMNKYDDNLDRIFGKAASERERHLRMSRLIECFSCDSGILK